MAHTKYPVIICPRLRRILFFSLVIITTLIAVGLLVSVFQTDGLSTIEIVLLLLYTILFSWICFSFWSAFMGFCIIFFKRDNWTVYHFNEHYINPDKEILPHTAVLMPIYNEDPERVFAGLHAIYQSLLDTGKIKFFDFFILSDTRDPDIWIEEELRWQDMVQQLGSHGHIFYRNRSKNINRKTGNIKDFCTNWGNNYRYMIILDADSLMKGTTLVEMVRTIEKYPRVALIQTFPAPVNRESLFARILQFAGGIYGKMFAAGLNYWQLGSSNYWGHNAIIRIRPFIEHCGLPNLPGTEPFGGEILSHDFVEAALLRRAGWEIWLAYNLNGSYEEIPPTLIDYAQRDRRWCQGNLQHLRLAFSSSFDTISRLHFMLGVMSYVASPLWLLFLIATGAEAYLQKQQTLVYFFGENWLPVWPVSFAVEMTTVLLVTLTMLFLPKLLALLILVKDKVLLQSYGGLLRTTFSVLLEIVFSVLTAPVLMLVQTKFILAIVMRRAVGWPKQQRGDHTTSFREALLAHGVHTLVGLLSGILSYNYIPEFFWWFTPVLAGLILSIPISILSSSITIGRITKNIGLFLIPEEYNPPEVLCYLRNNVKNQKIVLPVLTEKPNSRFIQVLTDPYVNALHISLLPECDPPGKRHRHYLDGLIHQLEDDGPNSLSIIQKRDLITDADSLQRVHLLYWSRPPSDAGKLP